MYKHSCIKCHTQYEDQDPDPYYCETCKAQRNAIAAEIDKKLLAKPRKDGMTPLQEYDQAAKVRGFMHVRL